MNFWPLKKKTKDPVYGIPSHMYGRLRHLVTFDADNLGLPGKTPEEQARAMNEATWVHVYFGSDYEITADDIRAAMENA